MTLERTLTGIAEGLLRTCADVSAVLAKVMAGDGGGGISLSLLSKYGPLLRVPRFKKNRIRTLSADPLMAALREDSEHEERVAALFGVKKWELASRFSVAGMRFFPLIDLPAPPQELRWIRYELLAALDCFGLHGKKALAGFIDDVYGRNNGAPVTGSKSGAPEKRVIEALCGYSQRVDCVALLDDDGFVVLAAGSADTAEHIAGNMALFKRHSARELAGMSETRVSSLSLYNDTNAVLIGKTPEKKLSLALAIHGDDPQAPARFLFDVGYGALSSLAGADGTIIESNRETETGPGRIRESWFRPPKLAPRGKFVFRAGEKTFHVPDCGSLAAINDAELRWAAARGEAIRAGLTPCATCRP